MICINENIRYQNVITKKAYFHYSKMKEEINAFVSEITDSGATMVGPLTYALHNVPTDENMLIEFIMPVEREGVRSENLNFHTYYSVENMVSTYVYENYETQMEFAYASLIEFLKQANYEIITPIFHEVDKNRKYIKLMIGYREI